MSKPTLHHGTLPPVTHRLVRLGYEGEWANPFKPGVHGDAQFCYDKYKAYFHARPKLMERCRKELAGRDLYCPCLRKVCYSTILFEEANRYEDPFSVEEDVDEWI